MNLYPLFRSPLRPVDHATIIVPALFPFITIFKEGLDIWFVNDPKEIILLVMQNEYETIAALMKAEALSESKIQMITV